MHLSNPNNIAIKLYEVYSYPLKLFKTNFNFVINTWNKSISISILEISNLLSFSLIYDVIRSCKKKNASASTATNMWSSNSVTKLQSTVGFEPNKIHVYISLGKR